MSFRLRTIETTAQGRSIVRDRDFAESRVTIGRAADNTLHLPDLALDPHHAVISAGDDGRIAVEALGSLGFTHDGKQTAQASIAPATGGELRFGSYRVTVSQDSDGAVLLTIGQVEEAEQADEKTTFSLAGSLPGKRTMSWLMALLVLAAFLVYPITSSLSRNPAAKETVKGDAAWSTGPLSLAHHQLEGKCESCHVKPFEPVADQTCLTCHKTVHDHAKPERLANARGPGSAGDELQWQVAHMFGKPGPGACSDCHTEHEGAGRMPPPAQAFCADCHGTLKDRLTDTALGNAADFGKLHPQFRPALPQTLGSDKLTRVSLAERPREASGLTFPHDLHLDPRSGVSRMAQRLGQGSPLACKDCHRPTADGVRFLPIDMERDCESCHSLAYDKVGATFRKLRHGDVDQMIADLSVAPRAAAPIVSGRMRPGDYSNTGPYFARFSPPAGGAGTVQKALSRDGICGECHTPSQAGGRFSVLPVTQVTRYFDHGWFTHAAHKQEKCSTCHAATSSTRSADLLLPDLKSCRTCHLGEDAPRGKVASGCAMCHDYHISAQAPRGLAPRRRS
jgi:hypothetical protein